MHSVDVIVVGAGVVGLACARRFSSAGYETLVLESEGSFGKGVSSRSSEVIHAGIFYPEHSLKARLCIQGREDLYAYCESRDISHKQIGKWIVATDENQVKDLIAIRDNAHRNGCVEVDFINRADLKRLAPDLRCTAALFSPRTGIIDSHGLMQSFVADIESFNGAIAYRSKMRSAAPTTWGGFVVVLDDPEGTTIETRLLINSAGLSAPQVANSIEGFSVAIPKAGYAKGHYFTYSGRVPFPRLVYPVPEAAGLGIHLTYDLAGKARFGPDVEWVESPDYAVRLDLRDKFAAAIKKYWPNVDAERLQPAYAGVRPKLLRGSAFEKDFVVQGEAHHGIPNLWNLLGIESPGLTASLALAEYVFSTHRNLV